MKIGCNRHTYTV